MNNWKKIIVSLFILVVFGTGTSFGIKFIQISSIKAKYTSDEYKNVNNVQQKLELPRLELEEGQYTEVKDPSVKLRIPLPNGVITTAAQSSSTKIEFADDKTAILTGSSEVSFDDIEKEFSISEKGMLGKYLGVTFASSEYDFLKAIYGCTPQQLNLSSSFGKIATYKAALQCKGLTLPRIAQKIYNFENEKIKGFMLSGSTGGDTMIAIDFYTDEFTLHSLILRNFTEEEAKKMIASVEVN